MDFTAPQRERYLAMEPDQLYKLTIDGPAPEHEEFKLGKGKNARAAPVFRVTHQGSRLLLTVTSTQLWESLERVRQHFGTLQGIPVRVIPKGDGKDRSYKVEVPDDFQGPTQAKLSVGVDDESQSPSPTA